MYYRDFPLFHIVCFVWVRLTCEQRHFQDFLKRDFVTLTVGRVGAATDTILQKVLYARDSSEKRGMLVDVLLSQGVEGQRVLVFVATKREADMLEEFLYHERFPATSIHGDRTQSEREQALKSFRKRFDIYIYTYVCVCVYIYIYII